MDKTNKTSQTVGITSLITFFTILILASFSLLIVSTATNDAQLSQNTSKSVSEYYIADSLAEEKLALLDSIYKTYKNQEDFIENLNENGFYLTQDTQGYDIVIEYSIQINPAKILQVEIGFINDSFEKLSWQTIII